MIASPFLLTLSEDQANFFTNSGSQLKEKAFSFSKAFSKADEYTTAKRAQREVKGEIVAEISTKFDEILHKWTKRAPAANVLQQILSPHLFAIAKNYEGIGCEPSYLPSIRVGIQGSRQILAIKLGNVKDYVLRAEVEFPEKCASWTPAAVITYLKFVATPSDWKDMLSSFTALTGTVAAGDALIMPPGWVWFERTHNMDFVGLRLTFATPIHMSAIEELDQWLCAAERQDEKMSKLLDVLGDLKD